MIAGQVEVRDTLIAECEAMRAVVQAAEEAAASDIPVLIEGEPGTGRELLARAIHYASARHEGEFVTYKPAATPQRVIEGDLEGGRKGPLRRADGGSLLIKDIVDVPRGPQRKLVKLVRRLTRKGGSREDDAPDVRFLASTDVSLQTAVEQNLFDQELYDRLGARKITLPPLRKRTEDIPRLVASLTKQFARELRRSRLEVGSRALDRLIRYPWPGNVAELKDVLRRVILRTRGISIQAVDLEGILPELEDRIPLARMPFEEMVRSKLRGFLERSKDHTIAGLYEEVMARVERPLIELVLEQTAGNQLQAAKVLGLHRNTLRKKICDLRISPTKAQV